MIELSKLQIRAKVLELIAKSNIESENQDSYLDDLMQELTPISDKQAIAEIVLKEYSKLNKIELTFCANILKYIIPIDYIKDNVINYIKQPSLSDEQKYKYVELLGFLGLKDKLKELPSYFEQPNEIIDIETKKLLEKATFNPEAMLDFLDFISNISKNDALLLLDSLNQDYSSTELANIVYPIVYANFSDEYKIKVAEILAETKSSLAIEPLKYLMETSSNEDIINTASLGLKKLKLAGATIEKAEEYYNGIINSYVPCNFFATIPDGSGSQAILITRANEEKKFLLLAVVISDIYGIMDSFGFYNISQAEVVKIMTKFYQAEGSYKTNPEYVKYRINKAIKKTRENKSNFPYEFVCWAVTLKDLDELNCNLEEFIDNNCTKKSVTKDEMIKFLTKEYTLRWYITPTENQFIKKLTDTYYNLENPNIEFINATIKEEINNIFDEKTTNIWKEKFYNLIYLLKENDKSNEANILYTIIKDEELFKLFKLITIQKSIFNYFVQIRENMKEISFTKNIFKKNSNENKYSKKVIENLIAIMRENWINE